MVTESLRIPVPGTYNFRDAGGRSTDAGILRPGKLFRSDGLHDLGEPGRDALRELGIRLVIDLRDDVEAELMPDDLDGLELTISHVPILEGAATEPAQGPLTLESLYESIVTQHAGMIAAALRAIADSSAEPVLVHCTAGKDRTGIVVALALIACGVPRADVVNDYVQSESNLGGQWLTTMLGLIESQGIAQTPQLRALIGGSPPEALNATLDAIDHRYGSVYGYLRDAGLTADEVARLRSVLVDETAGAASVTMGLD